MQIDYEICANFYLLNVHKGRETGLITGTSVQALRKRPWHLSFAD